MNQSHEVSADSKSFSITAVAMVIAVCGVAGSLYLSMSMGLKACPLCLYQRAFIMSAAAILVVGMLTELRRTSLPALLAVPAVVAGLCVSGFHVYLEQIGKLECPKGIWGVLSAPQQALAMFVILTLVLLGAASRRVGALVVSIVIGVLFAAAAIKSAPPPHIPTAPYEKPLDGCRPPYRPVQDA